MANRISTKKQYDSDQIGKLGFFPMVQLPEGWVECNGQSLNRETYSDLFNYLGVAYGADDTSTFKVPDYRGQFFRAYDPSAVVDPDGATRQIGSVQGDAIRNITGSFGSDDRAASLKTGAFSSEVQTISDTSADGGDGTHYKFTFDASRVVPTSTENRPKNISILVAIKAKKVII